MNARIIIQTYIKIQSRKFIYFLQITRLNNFFANHSDSSDEKSQYIIDASFGDFKINYLNKSF